MLDQLTLLVDDQDERQARNVSAQEVAVEHAAVGVPAGIDQELPVCGRPQPLAYESVSRVEEMAQAVLERLTAAYRHRGHAVVAQQAGGGHLEAFAVVTDILRAFLAAQVEQAFEVVAGRRGDGDRGAVDLSPDRLDAVAVGIVEVLQDVTGDEHLRPVDAPGGRDGTRLGAQEACPSSRNELLQTRLVSGAGIFMRFYGFYSLPQIQSLIRLVRSQCLLALTGGALPIAR